MKQVQYIMDKYLVKKRAVFTSKVIATAALLSFVLSGCVTQNYENDKTPVVKNQANRDDMAATRVSLGLGYLKMGNMPQAKQNLEKAKKFAPGMVQVYTAFAHYYETVGEHKLTVSSYEKALSIKSDDADTLNNYGVYLCRQNQTEAAEVQFLKAIAVPTYILVSKSYENLSSCFLQKDKFDKAEIYLNKAISHSPSSASTLFQMVRLQYAMGDYTQAKAFEQRFEKVTRRFTPQSLALAFKVYSKLGEHSTAKNYGTMLVKMYPQSWESQQYLLNELALIEPDNLAKRYQLTIVSEQPEPAKKRIVKLSPKKSLPVKADVKIEEQITKPKKLTENESNQVTLSTTKVTSIAANSVPVADDLATTMTEPKEDTPQVISPNSLNNEIDKKAITKAPIEVAAQDKRVVVINTPKVEKEVVTEAVNPTDAVEDSTLKDTEVIQAAETPTVIIEDSVESETKTAIKAESKTITTEVEQEALILQQKSKKETKKFPDFHVVEAGDTLYNISVKYNIKIKALRKWNKLPKTKKLYIKDIIFLENPKSVNK